MDYITEYYTIEEWQAKRNEEITKSPRQEEINKCYKLLAQCDKCKYNKANCNESFTCGANMCKLGIGYPCLACSFLKYVGLGNSEDQIYVPTYPCESFEEI